MTLVKKLKQFQLTDAEPIRKRRRRLLCKACSNIRQFCSRFLQAPPWPPQLPLPHWTQLECHLPKNKEEKFALDVLVFATIEPKSCFEVAFVMFKVRIFWEGHTILRNLHRRFVICSASQIYGGNFAKFCGLLRIGAVHKLCRLKGGGGGGSKIANFS